MKTRFWFLALFAFLLAGCGKYEEREREVGYKGLARINHLLAAERLANEMGLKASSYAGVPSLPPPAGTTLMLPAESLQSEGQLEEITDWVLEGGNLIVYLTLQNKERLRWSDGEGEEEPFQAFLDYYSLEVERAIDQDEKDGGGNWTRKVTELAFVDDEPYQVEFRSPYLINDTDFGDTGLKAFHSYDYGEGTLTILASAQLFTNDYLGRAEHASLLWDLLAMGQEDQIWFVHSTRISFFKLLWQRFPQAMLLLLVTLALLVWWAARGFGPKFLRGTNPSAKLDEHLEASGSFFLKHKAETVVISHLRARLFRKIARATNQPLNLSNGELMTAASEQELLSNSEKEALTTFPTDKNLLDHLQTLKTLDKRL